MARLVLRYREQNDISYDDFGLWPQNIHTIVGSTVNTIGIGYMLVEGERESSLSTLIIFASLLRS